MKEAFANFRRLLFLQPPLILLAQRSPHAPWLQLQLLPGLLLATPFEIAGSLSDGRGAFASFGGRWREGPWTGDRSKSSYDSPRSGGWPTASHKPLS